MTVAIGSRSLWVGGHHEWPPMVVQRAAKAMMM
jgi:hypothetical protein